MVYNKHNMHTTHILYALQDKDPSHSLTMFCIVRRVKT